MSTIKGYAQRAIVFLATASALGVALDGAKRWF